MVVYINHFDLQRQKKKIRDFIKYQSQFLLLGYSMVQSVDQKHEKHPGGPSNSHLCVPGLNLVS